MIRRTLNSGFSLMEMLTVLAITSILLGIIILPMIQSFNFTRAAESFTEAQERGRQLIDAIAREISNSSGVRDTVGGSGETTLVLPGRDGSPVSVHVRNARIDIVKPAQGEAVAAGVFTDPGTGKIDPTLKAPKGQIVLPTAAGTTLVRYFVGLRSPLSSNGLDPARYRNPYDGVLTKQGGETDNLYVLYRAEYQPYVVKSGSAGPNTDLFKLDPNDNTRPWLDDPDFFTQDPPDKALPSTAERQNQASRIQHWLSIAQIVTAPTRYDMILPIFNRATHEPTYDGNVPRVVSLIQFRPSPVSNEPASGEAAIRLGEETDAPDNTTDPRLGIAPDVFRTSMANWSSAVVKVTPYDPAGPRATSDFETLDLRSTAAPADFQKLRLNSSNGSVPAGLEMFDVSVYNRAIGNSTMPYPFSQAVAAAQAVSNWLGQPQAVRDEFIPVFPDFKAGQLTTSFGLEEVGNITVSPTGDNLPQVSTCGPDGIAYTPLNDPNTGGNFYDSQYSSPNERFNKVWADHPELRPNIHRFMDLRVVPMMDKWASPMDPAPDGADRIPWASGWAGFNNVHIVPNSEVIIGPDQNPGTNYGHPIRYTRTTLTPGPNQYRINYTNLVEPTSYSLIDPALADPPATYDPQDFSSAIIQPRYKVGYLLFDSDPNVPLPAGMIKVRYRFQFNRPGDSITVDYDSRDVMNVLLTIRSFAQSNVSTNQNVTLQATAPIRNFLR
jgi:prepilin-type N-terminal cleavage/methylation domain-containing protein